MENLPTEIFFQIFDYLDSENLRNIADVCQRFQCLIHNDTKLMNKFRVSINQSNLKDAKEKFSDMPYRKFDIFVSHYFTRKSLGQFEGTINSIIEDHTENIERIRLYDSTTGLASKILVNLENLTHLCIENIINSGIEEDDALYSITLPKLKILEVNSVGSYLKCIRCPNVEVLRYENQLTPQNVNQVSRSLNNFLKRSPSLKDLTLHGPVPNFETEKFEFKLQKFDFANYSTNVNETEGCPMLKLLTSQKDSIQDLKVYGCVTQKILEIVINEMKSLENLRLDLDKVFTEPKKLKINLRLKKLGIIRLPNFHHHFQKIIKCCPNVEILQFCSHIPGFILEEVSKSMKNLRFLTINSVKNFDQGQMAFQNLKKLSVSQLSSHQQLNSIMNICKSSQNLFEMEVLEIFYKFTSKNLEDLLNSAKSVEILKLQGDAIYDEHMNQVLFKNNTKLRLIELDIDIDEFGFEVLDILHETELRIIIPDYTKIQKSFNDFRGKSETFLYDASLDESTDEETEDTSSRFDVEILDSGSQSSENFGDIDESFSDLYDPKCDESDDENCSCLDTDACGCDASADYMKEREDNQVTESKSRGLKYKVIPTEALFHQIRSLNVRPPLRLHHVSKSHPGAQSNPKTSLKSFKNDVGSSDSVNNVKHIEHTQNSQQLPQNSHCALPNQPSNTTDATACSSRTNYNLKDLELNKNFNFEIVSKAKLQNPESLSLETTISQNEPSNRSIDQSTEQNNDNDNDNDADDEDECENDEEEEVDEESTQSNENEASGNYNVEFIPNSQFKIIQIESWYDSSDDQEVENSSNPENLLRNSDDRQQNLNNEDQNARSSQSDTSNNECDVQVKIEFQKRPRDDVQGVSSEEDIFIEITEKKAKVRKIR